MIVGLGLDLVEVERIRLAMEEPRFVERILTDSERAYCKTASQVAGRWAAKEAIAKAVGLGLTWQDVEILPGPLGAPVASIRHADYDSGRLKLHVTITHELRHAAAVAILERIVYQAPIL